MKYIFVGQNVLGGNLLEVMINNKIFPELIITREPDNYQNKVEYLAIKNKINYLKTSNINKSDVIKESLVNIKPDVIFCSAWSHLIKNPLLSIPKIGWINFHPSLLPKNRGSSPIFWAIANGDKYSGITAHFMSSSFDAGNIVMQKKVKIDFEDNSESLKNKIGIVSGKIAVKTYKLFKCNPDFKGELQDETDATYYAPRSNQHFIDQNSKAIDVYNLIRALAPYPCSILKIKNYELRIMKSKITDEKCNNNSQIYFIKDGKILFKTKDFYIEVCSILLNKIPEENYLPFLSDI